jgi:hypothetical protein
MSTVDRCATDAASRFAGARFPGASLVMLCGSWARGRAHADSDLDLIVVDPALDGDVLFEGALFESWVVEVCALPPERVETFFRASAEHRSVADEEVVAVAAQCHSQLALAVIDAARAWRGERKALRRTLVEIAPGVAEKLDAALRAACLGDRAPLLEAGHQILESLGGSQRTYVERY